jgi:uncharacterized protein YwgA
VLNALSECSGKDMGRTTLQKIAYFLTELGVDTGLRYRRGSYGPYAEELKPIIGKLMNNGLVRERRLGRMIEVQTGETFKDARVAYRNELQEFEPAIRRTTDLFMRVNTNRAEIVASIRCAASAVRQRKRSQPKMTFSLRSSSGKDGVVPRWTSQRLRSTSGI